ncbi:MAG TPA: chitinase [Streptosporangiaceae bacterium]
MRRVTHDVRRAVREWERPGLFTFVKGGPALLNTRRQASASRRAGAARSGTARRRLRHRKALISTSTAAILGAAAAAGFSLAGAQPALAANSWPAHVFAPYVDTGLSNTTLTTVAADYGTKYFMLAFVNGSGCQWSLPNQSGWQSQISALQGEGGDVSISFGGYTVDTDGTDLGAQCSSASAMAAQVESVVTTLNVTHLDFDIESSEETNSADYTLTGQALALVRSWGSQNGYPLSISYTLPVLPAGLTSSGVDVLQAAKNSGFTPNVVNIMTMDYGTSGTEMGTASDQALDASAGQLESLYGISSSAAYAMLGNTPMIGQNDTPGEIFTLADASTVESYAAQQGIALLSFWAEGRDNGGCPGNTSASSTCSGISQNNGAFTQAFQAFTGGGGTPPPPPPPTPTPTPTPTGGSCAAAWVNNVAYTSGNQVSYNGDNWTANQWNYDEVPGGVNGAWNSDGAC